MSLRQNKGKQRPNTVTVTQENVVLSMFYKLLHYMSLSSQLERTSFYAFSLYVKYGDSSVNGECKICLT